MESNDSKKVSMNLSSSTLSTVNKLKDDKFASNQTEVMVKSVKLAEYFHDIVGKGGKIVIETKEGEKKEVKIL